MFIQCPDCCCNRIRPEPHRWYEAPLMLLFLQPYRCRHCERRFVRVRPPDTLIGYGPGGRRKRVRV